MVRINQINNGRLVGMTVLEVSAIPYYELLNNDAEKASKMNQTLFSQILSDLHRRKQAENMAIEILWQSIAVDNQTYKAQVHLYVILRHMGDHYQTVHDAVEEMYMGLVNDLTAKNYSVRAFETEEEFSDFEKRLGSIDHSSVLAIGKKERVATNMFYQGKIYCTDVIEASDGINVSDLTNALSQYPNSAISLQLIPTRYQPGELGTFDQTRRFLSYSITSMRFGQGISADANMQRISDAFEYYVSSESEPLFYFNFLVYAQPNTAVSLASRVIRNIESEGTGGSALELVDITAYGLRPDKKIEISPWAISNILIYKSRDRGFWMADNAPKDMIRMKYLMTANEALGAFKLPIDDGYTIGLSSNKLQANRERLHDSIINNGSFKVGRILNDGRGKNASHAGIALNDYTKHGLIVGMPGSGKTNFSLGLLLQFWQDFQIPFLAIEPTKSEYRSLIDAIPELQVFTPGKKHISPYIINPFIPPKGVTVESYVPSLMSAFKAAFSMPSPLPDIFMGAINDCYNLYGWKTTSTFDDPNAQPFGLYEFIKVFKKRIQSMEYSGEVKSNMESAGVVRLVSLIEQNSYIYDSIHSIPLEDLLEKPTVIELNAINNKEQKSLIMALLLIGICVHTKNNVSGDGKLKNILLIDEAHVLLGGRSGPVETGAADAHGSTVEALEDMIAEIRSYGTGIIIADQSPTKVGKGVLANTNVKVVFKLVEKESKDAIAAATGMDDMDYEVMGRLDVGEAMLHYGRIHEPLHIKTYDIQEKAAIRPVISDSELGARELYWKSHRELLIPHRECKHNCDCCDGCDMELRANAEFIAARLVNEYAYQIPDERRFILFLAQMGPYITKTIKEMNGIQPNRRLYNCVKIKFLRKAMLAKSFRLNNLQYQQILDHPKFLKKN